MKLTKAEYDALDRAVAAAIEAADIHSVDDPVPVLYRGWQKVTAEYESSS